MKNFNQVEVEKSVIGHLTDLSHYLLYLTDLKGNIVTWNPAAEKLTGYLQREIIGSHFSRFYAPEEIKNYPPDTVIKTAIEKGSGENLGWRLKKNGERFWVRETLAYLSGNGSGGGFLVIAYDLTKHKEHIDIVQKWLHAFEYSNWGFAITQPGTNKFELVSALFAQMHGFTPEELQGKPITEIIQPESREKHLENLEEVYKQGNCTFESRHVCKDGSVFPVLVDSTTIRDGSNKILYRLLYVRSTTQLKQIHEALNFGGEKFQQLFEQASDGIFIADLDGHYIDVNTSACQMLGYSREELLGKTIRDLIPPEDAERLVEARKMLMKPGKVQVSEWRLKQKSGTYLPVEVSSKILPDGRWQAFVRDISERKKIQEMLVQSEQKFRGLLEESQDAIVIINKHGLIEFINKRFIKDFGYEREEIIGRPLEYLMPERDRTKHIEYRLKFMAHPATRPMGLGTELCARRKDGSEFPVDISLAPLETSEGIVFTAFIRDLSDRKRYEARQKFLAETSVLLSENVEFSQRLVKMAALFIPFLADFCMVFLEEKQQLVHKVSRHRDKYMEKLLHVVAADLFSRPEISPYQAGSRTDTLKPMLIEEVTDTFLNAITANDMCFQNFKKLNAKSLLLVPLVARQKIIGVLILAMSSSGRKFSEEDISFVNPVGYRIALSLENARLFAEAQQATRAREDILSIVSHDLKNPVLAVKNGLSLIPRFVQENQDEKINKVLQAMESSVNFMERLINDLLDFSKLEQGTLSLQPKDISPKELVSGVTELFRERAKEKSITLTAYVQENLPLLHCDPDRIRQVLYNLTGNAIKFTQEKGTITLRVEESGEKFHFAVADNGPGISKENLAHIFERYWQVKKTAYLGTGLGLFIAKGLIDAHKGKMWVESREGKGSTFHFNLPKRIKPA